MEQHRSVCSLEPVACEMKEFGCSVVVPRKELATHMRESELQHLTAMTVLNLHLSRQLQQDSTERDRKIAQLQQEMKTLQTKTKTKLDEMTNLQTDMSNEQKRMQTGMKITAVEQKQSQTEINHKISQLQSEMRTKIEEVKLLFPSLSHAATTAGGY